MIVSEALNRLGEIEFEIFKRLKSQLKNAQIEVWLSRKQGQKTNEGFGYVRFEEEDCLLVQKIVSENLRIRVKKQQVELCRPINRDKMREYLLDFRERQLHVSGLNRKMTKGKKPKNKKTEFSSKFHVILGS